MFHTMHLSTYPKMYTCRYATTRWISANVWDDNEQCEKPSFMCCCKLETGGLVIGWVGLIINALILASIFIVLSLVLFFGCQDMKYCDKGMLTFVTIMLTPFLISFMAMSYSCIKGVQQRDHKQVKSAMIWLGFTIAASFLSIFTFIIPVAIIGTTVGLIFVYFLSVIYSLYKIFLHESKRKVNETSAEA